MRLLLDTQTFLWWLASPAKVGPLATRKLEHAGNQAFVSPVVSWEIAIKYSIGKLPLPEAPDVYVQNGLRHGGFAVLPIQHEHTLRLATLPLHHRDPFDRLLIAQAQTEGMTIVTADSVFKRYSVKVLQSDR